MGEASTVLDAMASRTATEGTAASDVDHSISCCQCTPLTRVLHIINGEDYAGAERVQDLLAARLPACGFEVGFACVKLDKFDRLRHSQDSMLFDATTSSPLGLVSSWRLRKVVRNHHFQLIHAHTPRSAIVGSWLARLTGLPLVYHVHSPASRDSTRKVWNWINCRTERWSMRSADRLITVSQSLGNHMAGLGYARQRITVVPNGVPSGPDPAARPLPSPPWTIGMIALFRPRKGAEVLFESLRLLRQRGIPFQMRAVGGFQSPDYEAELKRQVHQLGLERQITWTGFCSDVRTELGKMDLMVLPSLFGEGLPMVVLEAMAAGVPVVTTHVEGIPEAVRDGIDGLIVEPNCPQALADALQRLVGGDVSWSDLRDAARRRQVERFSDASMAEGVAHVYREILGSRA